VLDESLREIALDSCRIQWTVLPFQGPADLEDCAKEVTPLAGTMVAFRRSERSFHGHRPHIGERRSLQLNWVTDEAVVRRELSRHRWSARLKALNPFG